MSRLARSTRTIACLLLLCALVAPAAGARSALDPCCAGMGDPCAGEDAAPCASLDEAPCCNVAPASLPTPQQRESGQQTQAPAIGTPLHLPARSRVCAASAPQPPVRTALVRRSDVLRL